MTLRGKAALVTGGSRGIGRGIAAALVGAGADVLICARDAGAIRRAADELSAQGPGRALGEPADVTEPDAAERLVATARRELGGLDILVSNVGDSRRKPFLETSDADWRELLELNLLSGLRLARRAVPAMRERGGGSIVFVASIWGREAAPAGMSLYQVSKSALISAGKALAIELAPLGIRVNSVAPGSIRFPGGGWDRRVRADPDGMADFVRREMPLGRFGRVEEVAALVAFLASDAASLITGACVPADGAQGHSVL